MLHAYVLKLENDKYFVGKTNETNKYSIINDKLLCSEWLKKYKYNKISMFYKSEADEDTIVKQYMILYGIDNVRGGIYSDVVLSDETIIN